MGGGGEAGREAKSARTSLPPMRNPGNKAGSARARDSGIGDCPRFHRLSLCTSHLKPPDPPPRALAG